ncbi:MAG TPA: hypothetical protein VNV25_25520 [Gemmatimonadaceae bacterium]|jgi:hypothetical protein|nr:hypothetical protein [Gemmatimonadaceae bacterium]
MKTIRYVALVLFALVACSHSGTPSPPQAAVDAAVAQMPTRLAFDEPDAGIVRPQAQPIKPVAPKKVDTRTAAQRLADAKRDAMSACRGSDGKWYCGDLSNKNGQVPAPLMASGNATAAQCGPACTVPTWYIDVSNTSGCASDSNSCTSAGCSGAGIGPCLSLNQVVARTGSSTPIYPRGQSVTINFVSAPAANYGPYYFAPQLSGGGTLSFVSGVSTSEYYGLAQVDGVNVVSAFGVDNTGATDVCVTTLPNAFNTLAANGQAAWIPGGTYKCSTQIELPSLTINQSPDATFIGGLDGPSTIIPGTLFYAPLPGTTSTTTLNGNPTVSPYSNTIVTTVALTAGTYIQIVSVAAPTLAAVYHVESTSTFTATLDHAMLYPFVSGDTVNTLSGPPVSVTWRGNGGQITGKAVGFIGGAFWNSNISGLKFSGINGTHADYLTLLSYGSYNSTMRDLSADVTGVRTGFNAGFVDAGQSDLLDNDSIVGPTSVTASGIKIVDARAGTAQNCQSQGLEWGLILASDATITPGVEWYHVHGGNFLYGSQYGLYVGAGSANNGFSGSIVATGTQGGARLDGTGSGSMVSNTFERLDVSGTAGDGLTISAGTKGTRIDTLITDNPAGVCVQAHDELWVGYHHAFTAVTASSPNILNIDTSGIDVHIGALDWNCSSASGAFTSQVNAASRATFGKGQIVLSTNSIGPAAQHSGSVVVADELQVVPAGGATGTIGFYAPSGTLRLGLGTDSSTCATPIDVTSGFSNRGQTAAGTAGGAAIAWPDLKSTDVIILTPTAATFTGWISATSPGTGFTLKDSAGGTYGYYIP